MYGFVPNAIGHRWLTNSTVAVGCVVGATAFRFWLDSLIGPGVVLAAPFFVGVLIAAMAAGPEASAIAAVLSLLVIGVAQFRISADITTDLIGVAIDATAFVLVVWSSSHYRNLRARVSAILEQTPVGVGLMNRSGRMAIGNSLMRHFIPELRHPDRIARWRTKQDGLSLGFASWPGPRALHGETVSPGLDFVFTEEDGREVWKRVAATPFRNRDGKILGAIMVVEDIDELKRSEQRLRDREQRLTLALEAGEMGTWEWNNGTNEVTWSDPVSAPGTTPRNLERAPSAMGTLIHPDDRERVLQAFARGVQESGDSCVEFRIVLPGGRIRWIEARGKIAQGQWGTPVRMNGVYLDVSERKHAEERQRFIAQELEHRTKNILTMVKAIVRLTHADSVPIFVEAVNGRIDALSRAHMLLSGNRWQGAELKRLVNEELSPYANGRRSNGLDILGPELVLSVRGAESLGLVIHELATNAAKYGALSRADGQLSVRWSQERNWNLKFDWVERGVPSMARPTRQGFGTRVINTVVRQLAGKVEFEWGNDGLHCHFELPSETIQARH